MKHVFIGPWRRVKTSTGEVRLVGLRNGRVELREWQWNVHGRPELHTRYNCLLGTPLRWISRGRHKPSASAYSLAAPEIHGTCFGGKRVFPVRGRLAIRKERG